MVSFDITSLSLSRRKDRKAAIKATESIHNMFKSGSTANNKVVAQTMASKAAKYARAFTSPR